MSRQPQLAVCAIEKPKIERLFQPFQLHRDRRLREIEQPGCPRDPPSLRDRDEGPELGEIEISAHIMIRDDYGQKYSFPE